MPHSIATPYASPEAIERLMVLIATILHYPGIGARDPLLQEPGDHDAIALLTNQVQVMARTLNIDLPHYSAHTIRKDLKILRHYGLLEHRMYRWGYYLGTGALDRNELGLALHALAAQAQKQGDPIIRRTYEALERRLRGLNLELEGQLFYPVRTQLSRMIMHTDPAEMMQKGKYRRTLFHRLEKLEEAIATGNIIQINRNRDPYGNMGLGAIIIYPLQLMYSDMAWYLLYEYTTPSDTSSSALPFPHSSIPPNGHLEIERLDRFSDAIKIFPDPPRGTRMQLSQLRLAHQLLEEGWGLYLGNPDQQLLERQGELPLTTVKTRFFYPISQFILEGDQRHPTQSIISGHDGTESYVDYVVQLPERSLSEFLRWVYRFLGDALVLAPEHLAEKHRQAVTKAEGRTKG